MPNPWRSKHPPGTIFGTVAERIEQATSRLNEAVQAKKGDLSSATALEWTTDADTGLQFHHSTFPMVQIDPKVADENEETSKYMNEKKLAPCKIAVGPDKKNKKKFVFPKCASRLVAVQSPTASEFTDVDELDELDPLDTDNGFAEILGLPRSLETPLRIRVVEDCKWKSTANTKLNLKQMEKRLDNDRRFSARAKERSAKVDERRAQWKATACAGCDKAAECVQCRPLGGKWSCQGECDKIVAERAMKKKKKSKNKNQQLRGSEKRVEAAAAAAAAAGGGGDDGDGGDGSAPPLGMDASLDPEALEEEMSRRVNHDPDVTAEVEAQAGHCRLDDDEWKDYLEVE